jgi:hypothetical protein
MIKETYIVKLLSSPGIIVKVKEKSSKVTLITMTQGIQAQPSFLQPIRQWFDNIEIKNASVARLIAKTIPSQCPFERDIAVLGRRIARIPPLCKLNPFYDQLVGLRFRALCYLADCCGEDIQAYC